jgi:sugar lactone lactonase YvrE
MPGRTALLLFVLSTGMMSLALAGCTDSSPTTPPSTTPGATTPAAASTPAAAAQSQDAKPKQVDAPAFTPPGGTFAGGQTVTISTTTSGAVIRYTTDGSTPTETVGTVYSTAVTVAATETIMAIAYQAGSADSAVAAAAYTITGTVAAPSFSPQAGTYARDQSVTITSATPGVTIHYTTDGSTPTSSSATYTAPISVEGNGTSKTIKAMATDADLTASGTGSATYVIYYQVAVPDFTPAAGTYSGDQSVTITCATPGAAIHFTTDGSAPTSSSPTYAAAIPVAGNGTNETIKAVALAAKMASSPVASAAYVVSYSQVSTPNFSLAAGTYATDQSVTLSCATAGAVIHYTTDATTPSVSSPAYSAPIAVAGNGTTLTVKALAVKEGMTASDAGSASYVISYPQVAAPVFNPIAGMYSSGRSVTISTATAGAEIHYTTDGSAPTGSSATYGGPITVAGNGTHKIIKAIATKTGMAASGTGTVIYDIYDSWQTTGVLGSGSNQFTYPTGVALDAGGRIYVADYGNNRVVRMDDISGAGWTALGKQGGGSGQFNYPARVALDSSGRIYVADMSNSRIVRIDDMSGTGWTAWGTFGSGTGHFINPAGVAVDSDGHIYVADSGNNRIVRIDDMSGTRWTELGTAGSDINQFNYPIGVTVDAGGHIYVTDYGNYRIVRMDDMSGGSWTMLGGSGHSGHSGINQFNHPACVSVDAGGHIYIADMVNNRIVRMDDMAGAKWTAFGSPGRGVSQFNRPWGVAVDTSGRVYVADDGNCRIASFVLQ